MYYSIVILTILYYLRVADLMEITSPYPRENIIASNYILADMQAIWISVTDNKIIKF